MRWNVMLVAIDQVCQSRRGQQDKLGPTHIWIDPSGAAWVTAFATAKRFAASGIAF
jgi:hypothetical protein